MKPYLFTLLCIALIGWASPRGNWSLETVADLANTFKTKQKEDVPPLTHPLCFVENS